jgi:hypothetical protein
LFVSVLIIVALSYPLTGDWIPWRGIGGGGGL